jgi:hypothetical protein
VYIVILGFAILIFVSKSYKVVSKFSNKQMKDKKIPPVSSGII